MYSLALPCLVLEKHVLPVFQHALYKIFLRRRGVQNMRELLL